MMQSLLPRKPPGKIPSLKAAQDANLLCIARVSQPQREKKTVDKQKVPNACQAATENYQTTEPSKIMTNETRGTKRKAVDNGNSPKYGHTSKRLKTSNTQPQKSSRASTIAPNIHFNAFADILVNINGNIRPIVPANLKYDRETKTFSRTDVSNDSRLIGQSASPRKDLMKEAVDLHGEGSTSRNSEKHTKTRDDIFNCKSKEKPSEEYHSHKRKAIELDIDSRNDIKKSHRGASRLSKRRKADDNSELSSVNKTTQSTARVVQTVKGIDRCKHIKARQAISKVVRTMRNCDLICHYTPNPGFARKHREQEVVKAAAKKPPTTFMDLPPEVRMKIFAHAFEDESYGFRFQKDCNQNQISHMIPSLPPSFGLLLLNRQTRGEADESMYENVRVEIDFGRFRPHATRAFMKAIGRHKLGERARRVFFIKKFGLNKLNLGEFKKAREIVSTEWVIEGGNDYDQDHYQEGRVDPAHVLKAPTTKTCRLKGLKERRFWPDHLAAAERYKRHIEGWCHPDSKTPGSPGWNEATDRRNCPFRNECLNLKDTVFCMIVKYKFGTIKGRRARHKEVHYDFYPAQDERLDRVGKPKSRVHRKIKPVEAGGAGQEAGGGN